MFKCLKIGIQLILKKNHNVKLDRIKSGKDCASESGLPIFEIGRGISRSCPTLIYNRYVNDTESMNKTIDPISDRSNENDGSYNMVKKYCLSAQYGIFIILSTLLLCVLVLINKFFLARTFGGGQIGGGGGRLFLLFSLLFALFFAFACPAVASASRRS